MGSSVFVSSGVGVPNNPSNPPTLLIVGDDAGPGFIEIHNRHAWGIDLYAHNDPGFKAPYQNFYKSRGTQAAPTAVTLTGYQQDSVGGINFGGYDGTAYQVCAAIQSQVDENWDATHHGGHISIVGRNNGSSTVQQIMQFGGLDAPDSTTHNVAGITNNIIAYRPIVWGGNATSNVGLFATADSLNPKLSVRKAPNSADAWLTCGDFSASGAVTFAGGAVSYGDNDSAGPGFRVLRVPNA